MSGFDCVARVFWVVFRGLGEVTSESTLVGKYIFHLVYNPADENHEISHLKINSTPLLISRMIYSFHHICSIAMQDYI